MRLVLVALVLVGCSSADHTDGGIPAECPNYNTSSGAGAGGPCTNPGEYCPYFEAYCHCNLQSRTWYCCTAGVPRACPARPPVGTDCCRAYPAVCSYTCSGGVATACSCTDDRWQCTTMPCD